MAWTVVYDDPDELAESDEFGNVRITDKVTGAQHMSQQDQAPTNPADVVAIPEFREPGIAAPPKVVPTSPEAFNAGDQYEPGESPSELAARFPGVPLEDLYAALNGAPRVVAPSGVAAPKTGFGGLSLQPWQDTKKMVRETIIPAAKEGAARLGLTDRPTVGEVVNPAYSAVKRAAGAAGAATVEVPRMAAAAAPVVKKAAYGAADVLNTPIGEAPQFGAAEAAANPEPATEEPPAAADLADLVPTPKSYQPEPGSVATAVAPEPSREDLLRSSIDALLGEKPNYDVEVDRWYNGLSGGQKAAMFIGAAASGFLEGFRGTPNHFAEFMRSSQQADIRSQEVAGQARYDERRMKLTAMLEELGLLEASASKGGKDYPNMPASIVEKGSLITEMRRTGDRLSNLYAELGTGQGLLSKLPIASQGSEYDAERAAFIAQIVLMLSGKQSNEREQGRLEAMIPEAFGYSREKGLQRWRAALSWIEDQRKALDDNAMRIYGMPATSLDPEEHDALYQAVVPEEMPSWVAEMDGEE